jgi:hypothetical protein
MTRAQAARAIIKTPRRWVASDNAAELLNYAVSLTGEI